MVINKKKKMPFELMELGIIKNGIIFDAEWEGLSIKFSVSDETETCKWLGRSLFLFSPSPSESYP